MLTTFNTPSTFHLDLFDNDQAPDPYYRDNLLQFYQYELWNWTYISTFNVDGATIQKQVNELIFEGLDTHTEIFLNNELLAKTNNSHREWIFDVKGKVQQQNNKI